MVATSPLRFALASATLSTVLAAQQPEEARRPQRARGHQLRTYDLETGRAQRRVPTKSASETFCYVNTDIVDGTGVVDGLIYRVPREQGMGTIIDWGVMGGTSSTLCSGLSDIVTRFRFAYATTSLDTSVGGPGAALTLSFYQPYSGWGQDSGNLPIAVFAFTGLPALSGSTTAAAVAYGFDVDLSGGLEICLPTGSFGFGYASSETGTRWPGFANTGPVMCWTGDGLGGPEASTGNHAVYDIWSPDTSGVHVYSDFGFHLHDWESWYLAVARADLSSSPAAVSYRNAGSNPASYVASPPVLAGTFTASVDNALAGQTTSLLFAFDTPATLTLGRGQTLLAIDQGSGEMFSGAGLGPTAPGELDEYGLEMPTNVELCGLVLYSQALQFGVPPFTLSNAQDLVVGG